MSELADMQTAFAAHLRDPENNPPPEGIEDRRLAIYRRLFFNNIDNFLSGAFPVIHSLYEDAAWRRMTRAFYARHASQGPQFWHIAGEFLSFLDHEYEPEPDEPPFLLELAHYEWIELVLSIDASPAPSDVNPRGDLLEGSPVIAPWARVLSYRFPVHQISIDFQPDEPPPEPTHLVVWRKPDDEIGFLKVSPAVARLLVMIESEPGLSGQMHLSALAQELNTPAESILSFGRQTLENLQQRGVILGAV